MLLSSFVFVIALKELGVLKSIYVDLFGLVDHNQRSPIQKYSSISRARLEQRDYSLLINLLFLHKRPKN